MEFVQNFPFFSIILSMFAGILSSVLPGRAAKRLTIGLVAVVTAMSALLLSYLLGTGESYTYMMGHFPAPWGNEIRAGVLEALTATVFCLVMLLSVVGGMGRIFSDIEAKKVNLFFIMVDLMLSSLLAMIYTNDLFTAYVFVEINTIAACGMIIIRQQGRGFVAAIRYMVISQMGSGLFLIGLSLLYDVTGHLLMSPARAAVEGIEAGGEYRIPMLVIIAVISVGLAIKSGLYPFHSWIPDTYGYATPTASAILSGLVSKGYIFLLIKIFCRVLGYDHVMDSRMVDLLFIFGILGMIMGSVSAIWERDTRRMIAYSSVAQVGYIYMGIGLGTQAGLAAAVFHMFAHAATKALLFISSSGLYEVSGGRYDREGLRGAGYKNPAAGAAFSVGAFSMVGLPMLSGFISKLLFATAATQHPEKMVATILALAVSTVLNAIYFLRLVIAIYTPAEGEGRALKVRPPFSFRLSVALFVLLNLVLGLDSQPIVDAIYGGLAMSGDGGEEYETGYFCFAPGGSARGGRSLHASRGPVDKVPPDEALGGVCRASGGHGADGCGGAPAGRHVYDLAADGAHCPGV